MSLVLVLGLRQGRFCLGPGRTCVLEAESLAEMLHGLDFDPHDPEHVLTCSSSIDHPEDEEGVPEGFRPRKVIVEALTLLAKKG